MKKVEDFQKTQKLMNEYNELENKMERLNLSKERLSTEKDIIEQNYNKVVKDNLDKKLEENDIEIKEPDIEQERKQAIDEKVKKEMEEKIRKDIDEYGIDPRDLEKEYTKKITEVDKDLENTEKSIKFFSNDNNFKVVTMEIKEMEQAVEDAQNEKNIEIAKMDLKYNELMAEKNYDGALEQRKLKEEVSEKFDKDIKELEDKITEYKKFKELLNEKLKDFTVEDFRTMSQMKSSQKTQGQPAPGQPAPGQPVQGQPTQGQPAPGQPVQGQPTQGHPAQGQPAPGQPTQGQPTQSQPSPWQATSGEPRDIYSNSKDIVNAINISAKDGKAYVTTIKKEDRRQTLQELDIEEILKNKKEILKNANVKELIEQAGAVSRFERFMARRKMNPVILKALENNPQMSYEYIKAIVDDKEFPFDYKIDLTDSILSKKSNSILNKLALKERINEGNEVIGAKRLYKIRNLFKRNKNQDAIEGAKEPLAIPQPQPSIKETLKVPETAQTNPVKTSEKISEKPVKLNDLSDSEKEDMGLDID